ncbi:MAG: BlaI/MecI/CopY family transcriptional regulator [Bacteroidota bacterium]
MKKLTKKEDQIMQVIWRLEKAFIKEIIEELPVNSKGKKPHYNTVATLVKLIEKKGFLHAELIGNSYRYSPAVEITDYREDDLQEIKKKYFGNSLPKMLAHFAKSEKLSEQEKEELIRIIQGGEEGEG